MSFRTQAFSLAVAIALLASASAEAASFSISPRGQIGPQISGETTTLYGRPPCGYCGPRPAPPIPRSSANDPYNASQNLNPGGGGSGIKPGKKHDLD
jgi:hypothetical protein